MTTATSVNNDPNISWDSKDHDLNGYIELIYIRWGNEMTTQQMQQLQAALQSTQSAVDTLNDITATRGYAIQTPTVQQDFATFAQSYNGYTADKVYATPEEQAAALSDAKTAYAAYQQNNPGLMDFETFAATLTPPFSYDMPVKNNDPAAYQKAFNDAQQKYTDYKNDPANSPHYFGYDGKKWSANDPDFLSWKNSMGVYKDNLGTVIDQLGSQMTDAQKADPNSLYAKLQTVYNAMPNQNDSFETWQKWALDGYNQGQSGTGKVSQALDSALTAAQSFLNQTTEDLQRFLNVMEQYYKSASDILKSTSDAMLTMIRGMSQ